MRSSPLRRQPCAPPTAKRREAAVRRGGGQAPRAGGAGRGQAPAPAPAAAVSPVDRITEELITAKNAGIACIVDAGHPDMGRDINFVRQVAMKSGMPIVASAGLLLPAVLSDRRSPR